MSEQKTFDEWAIVEVMGHSRFAGRVTEQAIGGASFVRIDVPAIEDGDDSLPAFTKFLGGGSIFSITPCTELTAKAAAAQFRSRPVEVYGFEHQIRRLQGLPDDRDG